MINETKRNLLRMDLQHFADGNPDEMPEDNSNIDENNPADEPLNTDETKDNVDNNKIPYDRFKAKVDEANALKEKLAKIEREQEAEKKRELEEQNKYKELYEQAVKDLTSQKEQVLIATKESALTKAGYNDEQVKHLRKLVEGDTDEEIAASIESLKTTFPVKTQYADPSPSNGERDKPIPKDKESYGRELYERIFKK